LDGFCDVTVGAEQLSTDVIAVAVVVFAPAQPACSIKKSADGLSFQIQVVSLGGLSLTIPCALDYPVV
jgi:hypothetical protein